MLVSMDVRYPQLDAAYDFICTYIAHNGTAPTLAEIAKGLSWTMTMALRYVDVLEGLGRIERRARKRRGIRLIENGHRWKRWPPLPFTRRWARDQQREAIHSSVPMRWYHRVGQLVLLALVIYVVLRALGVV